MVRLCVCRLRLHSGASVSAQALERALFCLEQMGLSQKELDCLRSMRNADAQAQSVGARLSLAHLLCADQQTDNGIMLRYFDDAPYVSDSDMPLATLCRTDKGAPTLARTFVPTAISFAHSHEMAVCAMTQGGRIGVDVEPLSRRVARAEEIVARCFSEGERAALSAAADREDAFLRIWTRKEALGKALGTGLNADAAALDTEAHPDGHFLEWTVEGKLVTVCLLNEKPDDCFRSKA